jgi:hypothetical protein
MEGDEGADDMNPHDMPDAAGLVEAVREFLERDVMTSTQGRVQFHTRVAINVLNIVQRELVDGPGMAAAHEKGLQQLGFSSERDLADAIRGGQVDDRLDEVSDFVYQTVHDKLAVANPKYFGPMG